MEPWMMIFAVVAIGLVAIPVARPNAKKRALARARATGDVSALVAYVSSKHASDPATAWDQLLLGMWQRYERRLAAQVLLVAVPTCDAKILQHWVMKVLQIEPEIAQEVWDESFLMTHFRPEDAAACGKCGCGG